jgi:hypothetical protein
MNFNRKTLRFSLMFGFFILFYSTEAANFTVITIINQNFTFNYNTQPNINTTTSGEAFVSLSFLKDKKEFFKLNNNSNSKNTFFII